jgi:hypothetical protein
MQYVSSPRSYRSFTTRKLFAANSETPNWLGVDPARLEPEEGALHRYPFKIPVTIWLDAKRPDFGRRPIEDVQEALAALHRFGLGEFRAGHPTGQASEWAAAAGYLMRAKIDPTRKNIALARDALERLARAAGVLATGLGVESGPTPRRKFG